MAAKLEVYKCEMCGNIVEVLHGGAGALVCCGEEMVQIKENTTDAAQEKHVPVKEDADHGVKVTVGSVAHPMESDHFIEWIEVIAGGKAYREFLEPGGARPTGSSSSPAASLWRRSASTATSRWSASSATSTGSGRPRAARVPGREGQGTRSS